jgi:hypothetical protein
MHSYTQLLRALNLLIDWIKIRIRLKLEFWTNLKIF